MTFSAPRPVLTAALALTLALGACSTSTEPVSEPPASPTTSSPTRDLEGTTAEDPAGATAAQTSHNSMDTQFAQQMIVHHEGAVEMAQLAQERAITPQVQDLAGQIEAAQDPEIELMHTWLQAWGEPSMPEDDMADMGHGDMGTTMQMEGMTQQEAMAELESHSGQEFDRRFLELMIEHHRGAILMAEGALTEGQDPQAQELAQQVVADQEAEIDVMEQMLEDL
ncbi:MULTISPECIES: DUF305 domain-containing protein [Ornithinimicrobium]|uniref:DUF305 domain-containing protein n=1 Tax=Ornithinimicrobium TaxID=125287 RepID=UPI00106FE9B8|nr:DUF305 domain-containing protein [Ornithinimicrobium flavum]